MATLKLQEIKTINAEWQRLQVTHWFNTKSYYTKFCFWTELKYRLLDVSLTHSHRSPQLLYLWPWTFHKTQLNCAYKNHSRPANRRLLYFSKTRELWSLKTTFTNAFLLPLITVKITSNEPWNREIHKRDRNPPITNN